MAEATVRESSSNTLLIRYCSWRNSAPVWAPAQLPPDGGPCRISVRIDRGCQLLRVKVEDAGGWRTPAELANFDPGWHTLPPDTATAWQLVRIETRGERAELVDLSLWHVSGSIFMIK